MGQVQEGEIMRIGILGCEVLKEEIEQLTEGDQDVVHREYLEKGLHDLPERLRETLEKKIRELEDSVDIIFLGYAVCKSLYDVPKGFKVPLIMLKEEDCIGSILGPIEYVNERSACPGTWFCSPGWAAWGLDAVVSDEQIEGLEEMGFDKMYFIKKELEGYTRCLYIDTGVIDGDKYLDMAKVFAGRTGLKLECRRGDLCSIKSAWQKVKAYSGDR
jgi:hypothetical protein